MAVLVPKRSFPVLDKFGFQLVLASCEAEANIVSVSSLETIAYVAVASGVLESFEDFEPNTMTIEHPQGIAA